MCSVFWVRADRETSFIQDNKAIATRLGLSNDLEDENILQAVRQHIEASTKWVLVLDNADNLSLFGVRPTSQRIRLAQHTAQKVNLLDYLPCGPTGTVLWTSRDSQASSLVGRQRAVHVDRMTSHEAETLMQMARNKNIDAGEAGATHMLLAELCYLPLAISQAAAYMYRTSMPIEKYLSEILERKKRWKALGKSEHDRYRGSEVSNSIFETWAISIDYLQRENATTHDILHILAYVDSRHITRKLICEASMYRHKGTTQLQKKNSNSSGVGADESDNDENTIDAITRLGEFSFLNIRESDPGSRRAYEMHKLVQEAARSHLQRGEEAYFARAAFEVVDSLFPASRPETWQKCEEYLVHAQHTGEWAALHKGEEAVAALLMRASGYLFDRGRWKERELVDKTALSLRRRALGNRHPDTIESMASLAAAYHAQGNYEEDEVLSFNVLQLRQEILGRKHPDTIGSLADLAATYHAQGTYEEAEEIYLKVLALRREILGNNHPDTIESMAGLATTYHAQGQYDKAEKIKVHTLQLRKEVLGVEYADTLQSMASLSATYHAQRRYGVAEAISVKVLQLRRKVLGESHPDTLESMASLAATYHAQGKYKEDERISIEVLQLRQEVLGPRHPDTIESMASLATTYHAQGRNDKAQHMGMEVLQLRQRLLGGRHPGTIESMADLAATYQAQERHDKAVKIYSEVLALRREVLGEKHPDTMQSIEDLARFSLDRKSQRKPRRKCWPCLAGVFAGKAAQEDNASAKTIATLTLIFLPLSLVLVVFSMSFFNFDTKPGWAVPNKIWVNWAFAVPMAMMATALWHWRSKCSQTRDIAA